MVNTLDRFACGLHADVSLFSFFFPHETKDVESLNVIKETVSVQRATMVMIHINKELYTSLGGSMGIF